MRRRRKPAADGHAEGEVPWPSFADALTGLLFVFILLALSFAYELQQEKAKAQEARSQVEAELERQLGQAKRARQIATDLVTTADSGEAERHSVALCLQRQFGPAEGFRLKPSPTEEEARLSLYIDRPGETISTVRWFESGGATLQGAPCAVARAIGPCLEQALAHPGLLRADDDFVLRVFVEGHTDSWPVVDGPFVTNWELSGARAAAVVRAFLVPAQVGRTADRCGADRDVSPLQSRVADGRLDVVAVGLAERRPAWKRMCAEYGDDPVCACLETEQGRPMRCTQDLVSSATSWGGDAQAPPADLLIGWANQDAPEDADARRRLQRRVDLRFEVTPRRLSAGGAEDG